MEIDDIKNDPYITDFLEKRSVRDSTAKEYIKRLTYYCDFTGLTPIELIEEARKEQIKYNWMNERKINKYITNFLIHLKEENSSENYMSVTISTINSFYRHFEIQRPEIKVKSRERKRTLTTNDIVKKEHILKALDHCNLKYKAIILLMSSSGMGQAEIRNLTYNDFLTSISEYYKPAANERFNMYLLDQKIEEKEDELIATWQIQRFKTGMDYFTFSSPESIQIIIQYLIDRALQNRPIRSINDYLFESVGKKLTSNTLNRYFQTLNDRCEFGYVGTHRFFTSHKLRKYFASTLHKNKIPELTTHWLLGHRIDPVTEAYFKADINSIREQYKSVVEDLSIENVILREVTTEGYDKLLAELRIERESREQESSKKDKQIENLNEKYEALIRLLGDKEYLDRAI